MFSDRETSNRDAKLNDEEKKENNDVLMPEHKLGKLYVNTIFKNLINV